ncbi:SEC7 domain protein [Pyrenophora tritici-repentis]|uniref:Sec7 domain containing protein n=1 Tax=Pyrenophora tritici-repentis TaxID=45151 RepID=A0A922SSU0_9PLEO|nr:SEC7 domain protein [Pyrenophora tritici-repentis]KAI1510374.1 Sec7 domain containing protein [Pyrenophora tritici-repentis]KAI1537560.1 SEC7 domain protein [Pyrenophora tritici-repentis]
MSDAEPPQTPREEEEKFPGMDADKQVKEEEEDHDEASGSDSDSASASDQAAEDAEDTSPPAPDAPQEDAGRSLPAAAASSTALEVPHSADTPRTSEQMFDQRLPIRRPRTDSNSTTATAATRPSTRSSLVFVVTALETIAASKDAKRNKKLGESTNAALSAIKNEGDPAHISPEVLFEPLQLASEAPNVPLCITALDCIGKLISYSYFSVPSEQRADNSEAPPLIERAIDTICDCFQGEATAPEIQLQIVKSLLAAILNDKIVVHGAGLLKAVRLTYNIFLLSKSSANQQVAQGALTQMVGTVFERVKSRLTVKESRMELSRSSMNGKSQSEESVRQDGGSSMGIEGSEANGEEAEDEHDTETAEPSDKAVDQHTGPKITLQSFENNMSFNDDRIHDNAPTLVTRIKGQAGSRQVSGQESSPHVNTEEEEEDEIFVKDAYLVFRAMCRLSTKGLTVDHAHDVRSQGMRSKLLSLHMIHTILFNNIAVFVSPFATIRSGSDEPTSFIQAVKQYLCLSLSRNGASSVKQVFEVACEIFWQMLKYLRISLKKEVEVFLKEIYLATLDKRNAPAFQKQYILTIFGRLAADPRALVEIYLNYDCDRTALDNMFQRVVEHLSKISSNPVTITAMQQQAYQDQREKQAKQIDWQTRGTLPPSLTTTSMNSVHESEHSYPQEYAMKQESLEALVQILRSLVDWAQQALPENTKANNADLRPSLDDLRVSTDTRTFSESPMVGVDSGTVTPLAEDDYSQLEKAKQRKTALTNALRQFNYKPKRGLKTLIAEGFIPSNSPEDIARFFLDNDQIDKTALGEFLGEGDPENIAIMHAFVDLMDFTKTRFTDALRRFLQSFRLPGEAQKIDRFMLKFAERYITGNPNAYANADTAYVLSYSVIMLNVDQHSKKMKGPRMTPADFIKNNRGINDSADLPDEYLQAIFDEISQNEIVLNTEQEAAADKGLLNQQPTGGLAGIGQVLTGGARDLQREAIVQASEAMANKTEQLYKQLLRAQRRTATTIPVSKFIPASSSKHVGPMFEVTWMPILTALSGQAQDHNIEIVRLCIEGIKLAIRISCLFDLDSSRQAFVAFLARFTNLYNVSEMKARNMEALKALIEIAQTEGNLLRESWREVLTCVSQLDRFQLISAGIDERSVPDVLKSTSNSGTPQSRKNLTVQPGRRRPTSNGSTMSFQSDVAEESRSTDIVRGVDRIFTNSANLSGEAIVDFVKALVQVSWQEIQSSGQSESPRTYSLQKLVEISGYNMTRVRFEWTNIWQILGAHFNEVGCHTNTNVVYFALNSLRQLSMKFMEIEELPGFKFQKDFLKPFEHIINNTNVVSVKDMVLRCLIQMIQARGENIRSGWKTMFGVFTVAAREPYEGIVNLAFENVSQVYNTRFGVVISQGAFADLIVCLTEFSKNFKFQKKSLQAIELLKSSVPKMLRTPECSLSARAGYLKDSDKGSSIPKQPSRQTQEEQFWFPVLFAFHDVLMTGEDLEVRSRALSYLFDTLITYGGDFPREFWDMLWRQLLYPIFMVLKSKSEMTKVLNHEELSVWLSTTMIQALRNMIKLFTHFFESLEYMLDRFLDLLALCICQENDTLARIGSNCLQQLILQNVQKFQPGHWSQIVKAFVELFHRTEATALFSAATSGSSSSSVNGSGSAEQSTPVENPGELSLSTPAEEPKPDNALGINGLSSNRRPSLVTSDSASTVEQRMPSPLPKRQTQDLEDYRPDDQTLQQPPVVVTAARRRFFNQIITKCVLQLLMIETVQELFTNEAVYEKIPSGELLRLMAVLKKSYHFAKRFNANRDLRSRLFREGFMKQPPNLLKQESGSASVYVSILFRMYHDTSNDRAASRADTEAALIPLCEDIIASYVELDEETQQRNIVTWRPVVVTVLDGYTGLPAEDFEKNVDLFAPLVVGLLGTEMASDVQRSVQALVSRIFEIRLGMQKVPLMAPSVRSPRGSFVGGGSPVVGRGRGVGR